MFFRKDEVKYIMIPPHKAQIMYMKLEDNPRGKILLALLWYCSVTEILKENLNNIYGNSKESIKNLNGTKGISLVIVFRPNLQLIKENSLKQIVTVVIVI